MAIDLNSILSSNIKNMKRSVIRELLKLTRKKEIISFAGGLPDPDTFPIDEIAEITNEILMDNGKTALQYGATEGYIPLREELIKFLATDGVKADLDNVIVTTASQQALDIVGKIFIDPGDVVIVERPTYVGAISAFNSYKSKMVGIEMDDEGMLMDLLSEKLIELDKVGTKPKFIYVIPDFQNPGGYTMSFERRKKLLEIASKNNLLIIEDSPYRAIRYRGETIPSLQSMDKEKRVISLYTFSKILFPGMRLGWVVGPAEIVDKFVVAKQAMDLCTPPFNQAIVAEYLRRGKLYDNISSTIINYKAKNELMLNKLDEYMPKGQGLKWTKPDGGLFLWVTCPDSVNTEDIFYEAIKQNVAYVTGSAFYGENPQYNSLRLNFSYPTLEQIDTGIMRLAKVLENNLK
jgi:2-aminoadipate transaminase